MRLFVALILLAAAPARAADADDKAEARREFKEGVRLYDAGEFRPALDAFKRSFAKYESPLLYYNIAQCQRRLGNRAEAIRMYKLYLDAQPDASDRGRVELIIEGLEHPPAGDAAPRPALPDPEIARGRADEEPAATATKPAAASSGSRGWLWALVAVAAVVVVGVGVAIGVALTPANAAPPDRYPPVLVTF